MTARIITLSFLLVAILGVVFFFPKSNDSPVEEVIAPTSDFYLKKFRLSGYQVSGNQTHQMEGEVLAQASDTKKLTIDAPRIFLNDERQGVWELEAETGEMDQAMNNGKLSGGVVLSREDNPSARMLTPELIINMSSKIVTSDSGVIVTQGNSRIESDAMMADLSRDTLKLTEGVRGVYVP